MSRGVIFVGPSLRGGRVDPPLERRPPAVRGDIARAVADGFMVIGLVDGELYQRPAVTPREIRDAAGAGVRLYGGASIGALRAVECPDAMIGLGEVYAAYRSGALAGDDEVAMTYDPADDSVIAYPLVTLRFIARARFAPDRGTQWIDALAALPFHARTRGAAGTAARAAGIAIADLEAALDDAALDVKAHDARAVIAAVADACQSAP